jgi:DNA-binding transcriptional regulator YiaG
MTPFTPPDLSLDEGADPAHWACSRAVVQKVRWHTGLTQSQFAETFRIGLDWLRDLEMGRARPDAPLVAYLRVIDRAPDVVRAALR